MRLRSDSQCISSEIFYLDDLCCFQALHQGKCVGAIVCKLDTHKKVIKRGYIAMLAVAQEYRKRGIGVYSSRSICHFISYPQKLPLSISCSSR